MIHWKLCKLVGSEGSLTKKKKKLEKGLEQLEIKARIEAIPKNWSVDFSQSDSSARQQANAGVKNIQGVK